jgi:hypothetical protein
MSETETILHSDDRADAYESLTYAALLRVLRFATGKPSQYALARELLTTGLMLPQECKGAYINGLAGLFRGADTDSDEWRKFRVKLQNLLLKVQGLVQAGEMLLQDWRIDEPMVKQIELFTQAKERPPVPDMTTGGAP